MMSIKTKTILNSLIIPLQIDYSILDMTLYYFLELQIEKHYHQPT